MILDFKLLPDEFDTWRYNKIYSMLTPNIRNKEILIISKPYDRGNNEKSNRIFN